MPPPFKEISRDEFSGLMHAFNWAPDKDRIDMHCTDVPDHASYEGLKSIESMWRYHTQDKGWSDIAQHISIAPDGVIWSGRDWNRMPASALGHNNKRIFMFEMIGNFDIGRDPLKGEQRETVLFVISAVQKRFGLDPSSLRFHNEFTNAKTCPGSSLSRDDFLKELTKYQDDGAKSFEAAEGFSEPPHVSPELTALAKSLVDTRPDLPEDDGEHPTGDAYREAVLRYQKEAGGV